MIGNDNKIDETRLKSYKKEYSASKLWAKIGSYAQLAGIKIVYNVLLLYYAMQSGRVSVREKALIIGALGYFILPADMLPDVTPLVGYTDDAAILLAVLKLLSCVDDDVKNEAKRKLRDWFGNYDDNEIK